MQFLPTLSLLAGSGLEVFVSFSSSYTFRRAKVAVRSNTQKEGPHPH
jgi:hypothetical protein